MIITVFRIQFVSISEIDYRICYSNDKTSSMSKRNACLGTQHNRFFISMFQEILKNGNHVL